MHTPDDLGSLCADYKCDNQRLTPCLSCVWPMCQQWPKLGEAFEAPSVSGLSVIALWSILLHIFTDKIAVKFTGHT